MYTKTKKEKTRSASMPAKVDGKATDHVGVPNLKVNTDTSRNFSSKPEGSNAKDQVGALNYSPNTNKSRFKK